MKNSTNVDQVGFWYLSDQSLATEVAVGIKTSLPTEFGLDKSYPNSFNSETKFHFNFRKNHMLY